MSAVRALFTSLFLLAATSSGAATVVTTLIDIDRNSATGCTVEGMEGVEHVASATIDDSIVLSVRSQRCAAGTLTAPEVTDGGWPAPVVDDHRDIELSLLYSTLGTTHSAPLRVGFVVEEDGVRTPLLTTPTGEPIVLDLSSGRRRAARPAAGGVVPVADGNVEEWRHTGKLASSGPLSVWLQPSGDRLYIRFEVQLTHDDAPVANADTYHGRQGRSLSITGPGVLANDNDPNGLTLTAKAVTTPLHGALELFSDGGFVYVHDGSEAKVDAFQYRADNGERESSTATVTLRLSANEAPVASDDAFTVGSGSLAVPAPGVLTNDSDADGDALVAEIATAPAHGTVTLNADGSLSYESAGMPQDDSFTYRAFDGVALSNPATVTLTLDDPANMAPVATAEIYAVAEDQLLTVAAPGVLANDIDANGDSLTVDLVTTTTSGTLSAQPDGSFTYAPNADFFGVDGFDYRAHDGTAHSAAVRVTINVSAVNDAPVAGNDSATVPEGGSSTIAVLLNDSDVDDDALLPSIVATPANGTVSVNADGTVTYTHDGSETLTDAFTYRAGDGIATSATTVVTITVSPVNDAPVAADDTATVVEGGSTSIAVTANDTDADDSSFVVAIVSAPAHGTATVEADGSITYVNDGGEATTDAFTYTIHDGTTSSNVATVIVAISPVNDVPVANADSALVAEGATVTIPVLANDTDPDSTLTVSIGAPPANGAVTVNADGTISYSHDGTETLSDSFTYAATDGVASSALATVTITVLPVNDAPVAAADSASTDEGTAITIAVIANDTDAEGTALAPILDSMPAHGTVVTNGDGTVTYTHDGSETTSDLFSYRATDGVATSAPVNVTITITPVNDAPVATSDAATVAEGGTVTIAVLANDVDDDDIAFTVTLATAPVNGSATVEADGTVTYVHHGGEAATDSFTYTIHDGDTTSNVGIVNITVTPVNDAPVANADSATLNEGGSVTIDVTANDTDPESSTLTPQIVSAPANGAAVVNPDGTITYTHDGSETNSDTFTYRVIDGAEISNTVSVTLTITPVNDAPVSAPDAAIVNEGALVNINVQSNDTDAEGNAMSSSVVSGPAHGTATVLVDGTIDYQHDGSETTTDSFTYRLNDGTVDGNTATVSITINAVNDTPVAADDAASVNEGSSADIDVLANDTDAENALLTLAVVTNGTNGTATVAAGVITYVHDGSETTSDTFTYSITDPDGASDIATVTVTITPVNDAAVATADSASVDEGAATTIDVLANDTDAEGDTLTPSIVTAPSSGTAVVNGDNSITYTHNGAEQFSDTFTYVLNDGTADSNVVAVTITINPLNDAPLAVTDTATVAEGASVVIAVLANDSDPESDALTVVLDTTPVNGTAVGVDGSVTYLHSGNETTSDSFTYHLLDTAGAASSIVTVTITVEATNDAPVAADDAYDYPTDGSSLGVAAPGLLSNDSDVDSAITASLVSGPAEGALALSPDGSFTYTKDPAGTLTTITFTYQASDGTATSNVATVTLTLNTAPVAVDDSLTVLEDLQLNVAGPGLLSNDSDAQNNITKVVLVSGPDCIGYAANSCGSFPGLFPPEEDVLQDDGSFNYQPPPHFAGVVTFTYRLEDGGGLQSNVATATITVTPVNDPPEFTVTVATINVPNNGQIYKRELWADMIQPGPTEASDESAQEVMFETSTDNPLLFQAFTDFDSDPVVVATEGVYVDATGTLMIRPKQTGSTTLYVRAKDNGGTANGGDDTSDVFFVTVNVVSANVAPTFTVVANYTVNEDSGAASRLGYVSSISAPESGQTVTMSIVGNTNPGLFSVAPALSGSGSGRNLTFTPAANAFGVATLTIQARDNGSPNQITQKTATITVTAVNDPPSFVKGTNLQYGAAVSGVQTIPAWATSISQGPGETLQTLTFNVNVRTGVSVFATAPTINPATGDLTFNLNGSAGLATIDVTLSDNGGGTSTSPVQTFLVAAGGINSPPSFLKGANVTTLEDSGLYTLPGWATSIDDGDASATQTVSFIATNDNLALFTTQPAVDPAGTLTFTPAANAFGMATVTIRAQDDGGTADGGIDTSDTQTFTITITGVNDQPSLSISPAAITRGENGGLQTIVGFATPNAGPGETGQTFTYTVTQTSGDPLFIGVGASAPAVAPNGTLTFQTAVDAIGTATFSVVAKDNGGIANSGVDTSAAQNFRLTITDGSVTIPAGNITIDAYPNIPISITNAASDLTYRLLEGVTVPPGKGPATVLVTSKPTNSLITIDDPATGAFTFRSGTLTYAAGAVQSQSFKFRACDVDGNCSAERTVVVNFGTRPLIFFVDDSSPQSPGLHTFDVPGRMMHAGFATASAAPAATYIVMSGNYTNGTTTSPVTTKIRAGDQVLGQGLGGLTFDSLGVVDLPIGTLPVLPDLSTGTTPQLHMPDPEDRSGGGIHVREGSFFLGYGGGTVKNLRFSKTRDHMNSWIMISRPEFTSIGGDYVFEQITCDNGQSIVMGQTASGSVTIRNSTLNISEGFGSNNGTFVIENTDINLYRNDGSRTALFYNYSTPGVVAQSYTIDASSSVTLQPAADLFSRTTTVVGTFTIDAPLTITRTGSVDGLSINGITTIALNGPVDVTTVSGKPLVVSNVGSFSMPNAANEFTMTDTLSAVGSAVSIANVAVGAAGVTLSNLAIDGGNLAFSNTSGGTITVASGTVIGNGAQNCVDRVSAANVIVDPAVNFSDCTP